MGTWGTGLYQDDDTCDIKEEYLNYLRIGKTNEEALQEVISDNEEMIKDDETGPLFWLALADTQWKYGRLTNDIRDRALEVIYSGKDLERWKEDRKLFEKRKKVLEDLKQRLNTEQPTEKKVSKMKFERPNWKVGDVILYQLLNEDLKKHKYYQKYVLLKVMGMEKYTIGYLDPEKYYHENELVGIFNWIGDEKVNLKKIDKLKIIMFKDIIDPYGDEIKQLVGGYHLNIRELKKVNLKIIKNDMNNLYTKELKKEFPRHALYNIYNFDIAVVQALEREEKRGNLVKDL